MPCHPWECLRDRQIRIVRGREEKKRKEVKKGENDLAARGGGRDGFRFFRLAPLRNHDLRIDRMIRAHGEKFLAARIATIRGEAEKALQERDRAAGHQSSGYLFQFGAAAARAVGVHRKSEGENFAGVKPGVARMAAPRAQAEDGQGVVRRAAPVGPVRALQAMTFRTNHSASHFTGLEYRQISSKWLGLQVHNEFMASWTGAKAV
jgi:hypothetical protein